MFYQQFILWNGEHHPERVTKYIPFANELVFGNIQFPVKVTDVGKFEKLNPTLSINVFGWEEKGPYPLYISKQPNATPIDLLLIAQNEKLFENGTVAEPETTHYVWIKSLATMLNRNSKHQNMTTSMSSMYACFLNCNTIGQSYY